MKYYLVYENMDMPALERWYLDSFTNIDPITQWAFTGNSSFFLSDILEGKVSIDGPEKDYTQSLTYSVPIVSEKVKSIFERYGGAFTPINITNKITSCKYYAMGLPVIKSINEDESDFDIFTEGNSIRPDKAGEYMCFYKVVLKENLIRGVGCFRVQSFPVLFVINEKIKQELVLNNLTGFEFEEVAVM